MMWAIFASSLAVAVVPLTLLAMKWRIELRIAITAGSAIGIISGLLVNGVHLLQEKLTFPALIYLEAFFALLIGLLLFLLRFQRDPERIPPKQDNVILSPADGKVLYTREIDGQKIPLSVKGDRSFKLGELTGMDLLNEGAHLIGIEMTALDVHVNRAPISGQVLALKRIPGRFVSLKNEKAEVSNERMTTIIGNGDFAVAVVQIASRLVRRIVSYLREGQGVEMGQRIGMIRFGSQVDLVIPRLANLKIMAKPGDKLLAGISVVAEHG